MIRFNSDYTEGCHTAILEKLVETNMEQTAGYGEDEYCGQARELIRKACGDERVGRGRRSHSGAEMFCSCHKRTLWQTGVKHSARNYNSSGTSQLASASLASARASSY